MTPTESPSAPLRRGPDAIYWREFDLALRQCSGPAAIAAALLSAALTLPSATPGSCSPNPATAAACKTLRLPPLR